MTDIRSSAFGEDTVDGAPAPAAGVSGSGRAQRRWSSAEKARIVSESHEPGATVVAVAARHGVSTWSLSRWRRQAQSDTLDDLKEVGVAPAFVPVVVEDAASDLAVTIEAGGVVVRLPGDSPVERIVGVAAGLGRAS